jgi:hypothetical protein
MPTGTFVLLFFFAFENCEKSFLLALLVVTLGIVCVMHAFEKWKKTSRNS